MNKITPQAEAVVRDRLKSFVQRIERLAEDQAALAKDAREVYAEAKGEGFDTKVMRRLISRRKQGLLAAGIEDELLSLYEDAVNGQLPLPLEDSTAEAA